MARSTLGNKPFSEGVKAFQRADYNGARKYFEQASIYSGFRKKSIYYLLQIDLKEGKYAKVRNALETSEYLDEMEFINLYGLLESLETNFLASRNYYQQCLSDYKMRSSSIVCLAKIHIQLCEYEEAKKMLSKVRKDDDLYYQAMFVLCDLAILECNYKKGLSILSSLSLKEMPPYLRTSYQYKKVLILSYMNLVSEEEKQQYNAEDHYSFYRLFNDDEKTLLEHINRHKEIASNRVGGYFFKDIHLKSLLEEAKEKISLLNSNYSRNSNTYLLSMGRSIGCLEDEEVSNIRLVSMLNTDCILTMYPISLSDKYDQEGFSTNSDIMKKRKKYIKR